jgi:hypothetical protein
MADSQAERRKKDEAVRATIMQKLIETGEKERLKQVLRDKLIGKSKQARKEGSSLPRLMLFY